MHKLSHEYCWMLGGFQKSCRKMEEPLTACVIWIMMNARDRISVHRFRRLELADFKQTWLHYKACDRLPFGGPVNLAARDLEKLSTQPVTGRKGWQSVFLQTTDTFKPVCVIVHAPHWHFYKMFHIRFTLHDYVPAFILGGGVGCQAGDHSSRQ